MAKAKVLLVDDDEGFLRATSLILRQAGFEVATAVDGRSGLAAAREHRPDVAVLDVIMHRPDEGFALARALRSDDELGATKLLLLTAVAQQYQMLFEPDEQWLPVEKVLEKPVSPERLVQEIEAVLDRAGKED